MNNLVKNLEDILPHSHPMILIDKLIEADAQNNLIFTVSFQSFLLISWVDVWGYVDAFQPAVGRAASGAVAGGPCVPGYLQLCRVHTSVFLHERRFSRGLDQPVWDSPRGKCPAAAPAPAYPAFGQAHPAPRAASHGTCPRSRRSPMQCGCHSDG